MSQITIELQAQTDGEWFVLNHRRCLREDARKVTAELQQLRDGWHNSGVEIGQTRIVEVDPRERLKPRPKPKPAAFTDADVEKFRAFAEART